MQYILNPIFSSVQSLSHVLANRTLCDLMNCSMSGFPVHHQLPEPTQIHVHRISDANQPSHPLLSPSPPTSIIPSIRVFSNESVLCIRWPKYWSFSFSISEMPANLENSAVATGLEKVSFHSNPRERQCQRMFKLLHSCTHLTH